MHIILVVNGYPIAQVFAGMFSTGARLTYFWQIVGGTKSSIVVALINVICHSDFEKRPKEAIRFTQRCQNSPV